MHPTAIREEGEHFKDWKLDVVNNPDPVLNEANGSVIASYELIDDKIGWILVHKVILNCEQNVKTL